VQGLGQPAMEKSGEPGAADKNPADDCLPDAGSGGSKEVDVAKELRHNLGQR